MMKNLESKRLWKTSKNANLLIKIIFTNIHVMDNWITQRLSGANCPRSPPFSLMILIYDETLHKFHTIFADKWLINHVRGCFIGNKQFLGHLLLQLQWEQRLNLSLQGNLLHFLVKIDLFELKTELVRQEYLCKRKLLKTGLNCSRCNQLRHQYCLVFLSLFGIVNHNIYRILFSHMEEGKKG